VVTVSAIIVAFFMLDKPFHHEGDNENSSLLTTPNENLSTIEDDAELVDVDWVDEFLKYPNASSLQSEVQFLCSRSHVAGSQVDYAQASRSLK
jgi:hypothetical protein